MDAKDLLIEKLQGELQRKTDELLRKDDELQQAREQHQAVSEQFQLTLQEKNEKVAALEHQIKLLLQRIRGSRQERIDPDQLLLFSLEELQQLADELDRGDPEDDLIEPADTKKKRRRSPGRVGKLPSHLPRKVIRHELEGDDRACPCCGEDRQEIGVESSEQLEVIPAKLMVIQHDRVKYACRHCEENVAIAAKPPQPIEKGLPGPGLCAHTVLSKFGDHLPLYRQEDIHSRLGMDIRRSTLCGWLSQLAELAMPLVTRMKTLVLDSKVIHTDDTSIKMLMPGSGTTLTAKFWPYLGDWLHPYAVYDFTTSRERDGPRNFLSDYEGYLQADAYSGYDCVYATKKVSEVACWVHARRYWHQAVDNDSDRANEALGYIARLSQIETKLSKAYPRQNLQGLRDFDSVAAARKEHSLPILNSFKSWMEGQLGSGKILPKSVISKAFTYTLNQWDALCRYCEQGYLSTNNNVAERLVKIPAIGRKNYLFVGGIKGGNNAAIFYSLVSSSKANGVEPFAWLRDLFSELPRLRGCEAFEQCRNGERVTSTELDYLLPDIWLRSNPESTWTIDEVRRKERRQKAKRPKRRRNR